MSANKFEGKHSQVTDMILQAFYKVHRILGYGFGEKVYQNSMAIELRKLGFQVATKEPIEVFYDGQLVGEYEADLLVNDVVLLELKAVKQIIDEHEAQLLNYLKATRIEVGLVLNFGPTAEIKRRVYDNERKGTMTWLQQKTDSTAELETKVPDSNKQC